MTIAHIYRVIDCPASGTGNDCGTFTLDELPQRLRDVVQCDPDNDEWSVPALSNGDTGEELPDLTTLIVRDNN